jgi:hypothetical protein
VYRSLLLDVHRPIARITHHSLSCQHTAKDTCPGTNPNPEAQFRVTRHPEMHMHKSRQVITQTCVRPQTHHTSVCVTHTRDILKPGNRVKHRYPKVHTCSHTHIQIHPQRHVNTRAHAPTGTHSQDTGTCTLHTTPAGKEMESQNTTHTHKSKTQLYTSDR